MKYEPLLGMDSPSTSEDSESGDSELPDINDHFSAENRVDRIRESILDVIEGSVARGRHLKYWENLKLKPEHIQMLIMKAAGFSNKSIAEKMEYDQSRVSVIVNHPDAQWFLSQLMSAQAENSLDIKARIQAHAGEALDTALLVMRTGKAELRERVAFKLLDRAGYGAVQKSEAIHKFEIPATQAASLTRAVIESQQVEDIPEADWEEIEQKGSSEVEHAGGVGNPGSSDEDVNRAEPPGAGLHVSTPSTHHDLLDNNGGFDRPEQQGNSLNALVASKKRIA